MSSTMLFELNTGEKMPAVGLGTWQADTGVVGEAVISAVKLGYRHIDCAHVYGNEKEIGDALNQLFKDGIVLRKDLWITSKLWCRDHHPEDVSSALERTLRNLQLDTLDLYLIHWPCAYKRGSTENNPENLTKTDIPSTWRAMEELYYSGKVKAIGVSNFSTKKLGDLLDVARVKPSVNQVECHPQWQQQKLHDFCRLNGIHITAYSPLGSPGNEFMKGDVVLENPIICSISERLGKSPAQVTLRWGLQMGHSVLPKSTVEAWTRENLDVFTWSIPDHMVLEFSEIKQGKLLKGTEFLHQTLSGYPTLSDLWNGEI